MKRILAFLLCAFALNAAPATAEFGNGITQKFNPSAVRAGMNFGLEAGNPSSLFEGDAWVNSVTHQLMFRTNTGTTQLLRLDQAIYGTSVGDSANKVVLYGPNGEVRAFGTTSSAVSGSGTDYGGFFSGELRGLSGSSGAGTGLYAESSSGTNIAAFYDDGAEVTRFSFTRSGNITFNNAAITATPPTANGAFLTTGNTIGVAGGGTGLTSGTSGGVPTYTASGTLTSSGALTNNDLLLGGGAGAVIKAGVNGGTTTVLHGGAGNAPTFSAVSLTADVSGVLPAANGGTGLTGVPFAYTYAISDEVTDVTTGTAKLTVRAPHAMTLTAIRLSANTAPTGSIAIVDVNESGSTIMTTNKLSLDASEKTSTTAATAPGLTDTSIADDAEITFDIDQIGSTIAGKGFKVTLIGNR